MNAYNDDSNCYLLAKSLISLFRKDVQTNQSVCTECLTFTIEMLTYSPGLEKYFHVAREELFRRKVVAKMLYHRKTMSELRIYNLSKNWTKTSQWK